MPYLQRFQGNAPLVPFMTTEVTVLLETLMAEIHKTANNPAKSDKLNVLEASIHLATADIDVGFAATVTHTKALLGKKAVKMYQFKKECCAMLAKNCYQNTRQKSTEVKLCQEAGKFRS